MKTLLTAETRPRIESGVSNCTSVCRTTTLMRYDSDSEQWIEAAELPYRYEGNRLEVIVPRKLLGLTGDGFTFDFKWSDNAYELEDPISLCLHGDTAPNRRFNYRCIWNRR